MTSVQISKRHDRMLERIIGRSRRSKKSEIELMIEREASNLAVN